MKTIKQIIEDILFHYCYRFIYHISYSEWGVAIPILHNHGVAFGRIYWFNNDDTTVYLDWLSVDEMWQHKGYGTKLQEIREEIGRQKGAIYSCLWVNRDTWIYDWYVRRGYEYYMDYDQLENAVWLRKLL